MQYGRKSAKPQRKSGKLDEIRQEAAAREKSYRGRALALFPHVCGHCGREFEGKRLKELTVHHKDHNHDNNPPDGSNWELLCLFCHEYEHVNHEATGPAPGSQNGTNHAPEATHKPFGGLDRLLGSKSEQE